MASLPDLSYPALPMISISNLGKHFAHQTLFSGVSMRLNAGNRYGLVGANGSGKSTFLRIVSGEELPSEGTLAIPKRIRLGVLKQDHFEYESHPILDVVMMGRSDVWEAMVEKETLLERADQEFDADRYAELEDVILHNDGYALEAKAAEVLEGLGIPAEIHRQPLSTLSGGFKLRVLLAQVLAAQPDALLLDEPTNHLDILSIRWLEKFLSDFRGCVLVISHDHRFLDNVSTHILDVDYETILLYPGNYEYFTREKVAERERKEAEISRQEKKIAEHQAFVDRFRAKATKARQAQSKQKLIDKVKIERLPQTSRRYPLFRLRQQRPSGREVVQIDSLSKAYGDNQVLEDVSLTLNRGDRLAIIGPNGIGKSTLLKILVGHLDSDAGKVEWGYETYPGYFAQDHHDVLAEVANNTVEAALWDICPSEPIGFVRGQLAQLLFSGDEADKKVRNLSGGEAARLVFARLAVQQPNVLVLDEPTNHLDLEAIEALVQGLEAYEGTLVFVSHDRWFVGRLANRILEITPGGISDFRGSFEEYLARCGDDHLDADSVLMKARQEKRKVREAKKGKSRDEEKEDKKRRRQLESRREQVTQEIEKAEARVHEINEIFCDPTYFDKTPQKDVRKLENEQKGLQEKLEGLMEEWEEIESELEEL